MGPGGRTECFRWKISAIYAARGVKSLVAQRFQYPRRHKIPALLVRGLCGPALSSLTSELFSNLSIRKIVWSHTTGCGGAKKPFYHITVSDSRRARDGCH